MKDIDFDELDKAVNSLMATAPASTDSAADETKPETTLEVPSHGVDPVIQPKPPVAVVSSVAETVTVTTPSLPTPPAVTPTPTSTPTPATPAVKRAGRFMDMVHTSSDMKPRPASVAPSREGLSITPRPQSAVPTSTPPAETIAEAPVDEPSQDAKTPDVMPDPIDLSGSLDTPATESSPAVESATPTTPAMAESPFIADAKVEKRPLNPGTSALESYDSQFAHELGTDAPTEQAEQTPVEKSADEPPEIPQVPELSSDLVAIESNDKIEEPVATQTVDTKDAASTVGSPATPLGAASIAQQYKSQPSTGDQSHAAIYDASQYPEPITHPAKKKSGWLWVLWVVLLLGVGAGAAALLYFLGIIP